jgi:hypothetical protein
MKDFEANEICIGDTVYYARKNDYKANGVLIKCVVININIGNIYLKKYNSPNSPTYKSTNSEHQILIVEKIREKKIKRILK